MTASIITTAIATAVTCLFADVFLKSGFASALAATASAMRRSLHTIRSSAISDHWKEKALLAYSRNLLSASLRLAAMICALAACYVLAVFVLSWGHYETTLSRIVHINGPELVTMFMVGAGYFLARRVFMR